MTESRKILFAAIPLAVGYCLALFLGGFAEIVGSNSTSAPAASVKRDLLSTIQTFLPDGTRVPGSSGILVPDGEFVAGDTQALANTSPPAMGQPTWLAVTSLTNSSAVAPSLSGDRPTTPDRTDESTVTAPQPPPKARITNVVASANTSATTAPSPWDRWPRWEPNASAISNANGLVAATFQSSPPARPEALQVMFNADEIIRNKNTPLLDRDVAADYHGARTHVVVDGDSLAKLADRYLDDAELDDEIYRLNRDVLNSPDLLPIGVELRIPDSRLADSLRALAKSHSSITAKPNAPSGMIPVDWTPNTFDSAPQAQLLQPVLAGHSD